MYDEKTGQRAEYPRGSGLPILRPRGTHPPCSYGADKCPKGSPSAGRELTEENWQAYRHYQECSAVGRFPDDPIVRQNAGIIADVIGTWERMEQRSLRETMLAICGVARMG